jgi:hypothetical protein
VIQQYTEPYFQRGFQILIKQGQVIGTMEYLFQTSSKVNANPTLSAINALLKVYSLV